jgi:hypothetical protein
MRMLAIVSVPVETGNDNIIDGTLGQTIQSILEAHRAESAYFTVDAGERTGYIVFDMTDATQMISFAEPFFLAFNASVDFKPVMTPDDLMRGMPVMEKAAKQYA